jgi:integrase
MAVRRAQTVDTFLDWLIAGGYLEENPFAELRRRFRNSTAAIVRALLSPDPSTALSAIRSLPPFGSHLGPVMREHVERMRTLGYQYREDNLRRFDHFLQTHPGSERKSLATLVKEYAAAAPSAYGRLRRMTVGRTVARALMRTEPRVTLPGWDRALAREVKRRTRRPYIFTHKEVARLLDAALTFPSPHAPLRPLTLYTMLVLAYCAGLRVGEIARLRVRDIRQNEGTLDILQTKFYKSRRLPVQPGVLKAVRQYLAARTRAGIPPDPDGPLFCHEKGGYARITAEQLLRRVLQHAGFSKAPGRAGPRPHDLRHTFVVHRMLAWYREGVNPQSQLPYLATYLGHRDIHSTLVYLTITRELLAEANSRFRAYGAQSLGRQKEGASCP